MTNGTPFKLGRFARGNQHVAAIVLGDQAIDLATANAAFRDARRRGGVDADTIDGLLYNWDANFAALQEIVAFLEKDGTARSAPAKLSGLRPLAPVARPGKMFYAAQNF